MLSMVRTGQIDTVRATKLFEKMRDAVVAGKLEAGDAGSIDL